MKQFPIQRLRWPFVLVAIAILRLGSARGAELPIRTYRISYLPQVFSNVFSYRMDDRGVVFGARPIPRTFDSPSTGFLIYRPVADGNHPAGVQAFPAPVTGWNGRFELLDVNNHGQFIISESSAGFDHRFVYNGATFVELRDPRRPDVVDSNDVVPNSIHDNGTIWGATVGVGAGDFGGIAHWDLSGNATQAYQFTRSDDPLRFGSFRNELGYYLRFNTQLFTGVLTDARLWDGLSAATGPVIDHPPSLALQLNDNNELAGIAADNLEAWIYLPVPAHGLSQGLHRLGERSRSQGRSFFLNNRGQVFLGDDNGRERVWSKGSWSEMAAVDADSKPVEIRALGYPNARGQFLAGVVPPGSPIVTLSQGVLTPLDLEVTSDITPKRGLTIGEEVDMALTIQNHLDVPLFNVGILVSSMGLIGDLILDWVKAPPQLLSLGPGASGTLHYVYRTKGSGKVKVRFKVQGLDGVGNVVAITDMLSSPDKVGGLGTEWGGWGQDNYR